jgi:NAD-dependent SIR2 family protein deacetylase
MPIQTPALKLTCSSCGWTKLFPPMGDVRYPGQVPDKCPTCGSEHLKQVQPNFAEKMLANVLKK